MTERITGFNFEYRVVGTTEWKHSGIRDESHSSWASNYAIKRVVEYKARGIDIEVREVIVRQK